MTVVHQRFSHGCGQRLALDGGKPVEHHVERARSARCGEAAAVDDVAGVLHHHTRERFAEGRQRLPVAGGAVAIEHPRARQQERAGVGAAEKRAGTGEAAQFVEHLPAHRLLVVIARRNDDKVPLPHPGERTLDEDRDAVRGGDGLPVHRHEPPGERTGPEAVGDAQRLQRRIQRDHGETRQEQEHGIARVDHDVLTITGKPMARKVKS